MSLSRKIGAAMGLVLLLMAVIAVSAVTGIGGIVGNADEVISGNKLRGEMVQREVDHLNWANHVNALLTDAHVTELDVETDPAKCAFGKWYNSPARREAEQLIPELAPILAEIDEPHCKLHESAIAIDKAFEPVDLAHGDFLREAKTAHLAWAHRVKDIFVDTSMTSFKNVEMDPHRCEFGQWLYSDDVAALKRSDPDFAAIWQRIEPVHARLHISAAKIEEMIQQGDRAGAADFYMANTKPVAYEVLGHIDEFLHMHQQHVDGMHEAEQIYASQTRKHLAKVQELLGKVNTTVEENLMTDAEMLAAAQRTRMSVVIMSIVGIVVGIGLAWLITRSIIGPIRAIVDRIKDIAQGEGDLTKRVDVTTKDEIGELGTWFNTFVQKVHDIVAEVAGATREVASAANEIAASSEQMATGMTQQTDQTTQVSAAVEEMSATVVEVARKAGDAASQSDEAGRAAEAGGDVVRQTVDGINQIAQVVNDAAAAIGELGKRGEQIGEIIGVINDIADQTNLLALNAAIEAARAGEHGRGFAVVADEVRKLAERTTEATKEVADSIKAIQSETGKAVDGMSAGTERVQQGVVLANQAGESLSSIVDNARNVAAMIQSIAAATEQQSASAEQISRNIDSITAVSRQSSEGAAQAASAAVQLSTKSEQLQKIVGQFRLADR